MSLVPSPPLFSDRDLGWRVSCRSRYTLGLLGGGSGKAPRAGRQEVLPQAGTGGEPLSGCAHRPRPGAGKGAGWEPAASLAGGHPALSSASVAVEPGPGSDGRMFLFGSSSSIHSHCMRWGPGESETFPSSCCRTPLSSRRERGMGPWTRGCDSFPRCLQVIDTFLL